MRQKFTLFFLLLLSFSNLLFSQSATHEATTHPFELGINGGGSWLTSDIRMGKLGGGFGLTFGQTYGMNKKNMFTAGWRLRFLDANQFGQDYRRSYGLKNNEVLNGTLDTSMNYAANPGYVYQNYKTHLDEFSLEGVLSFNQAVYYVYPYVFGGVGLTRAVARTNQLDNDGLPYDYSSINSSGADGKFATLSQLHGIQDNSYETLADGNRSPGWKFMPSVGVGLGFELAPAVSIGLEYKLTWALNDVLDGQRWTQNNTPTAHNDLYHYANIWLKLDFGRGTGSKNISNTNTVNYTPLPPPMPLPVISIANPPAPNLATSQPLLVLAGKIYNIHDVNDMHIAVNGVPASGYFYNPETQDFSFGVQLAPGVNTFDISAINASGTVYASTNVIFELPVMGPPPPNMGPPPVVEIREPYQNPFFTNDGLITVRGTAMHISNAHELQVTVNGFEEHGVSFNPTTHTFAISAHLAEGANTFVVTASNPSGSDTKATTVITKQVSSSNMPGPRITMVNPAINPYSTINDVTNISATVTGVDVRGGITVITNGAPNNSFIFDPRNGSVTFSMHLVQGNNTLHIQAVNGIGSDVKDVLIVYAPPIQASEKPQITITTPSVSPSSTLSASASIVATVNNVTTLSEITATLNGAPIAAAHLNFVAATHQLNFNVNLITGANTVMITATNASGSDTKIQTIIRSSTPPPVTGTENKPVVTMIVPSSTPYVSGATQNIEASVTNVTALSQIVVTLNGAVIAASSLNFNPASHQLAFNLNLTPGLNTLVITATNSAGSDSKTVTLKVPQPTVNLAKPMITITNPTANPFSTNAANYTMTARIAGVTNASGIAVTLNGHSIAAGTWTYDAGTQQFSYTVSLNSGSNSIQLTATNDAGSISGTQMIIRNSGTVTTTPRPAVTTPHTTTSPTTSTPTTTTPATTEPTTTTPATTEPSTTPRTTTPPPRAAVATTPQIELQTPSSGAASTTDATYTIVAVVTNINAVSDISVTVNGSRYRGTSFNTKSGELSVPLTLVSGANTVIIVANNGSNSALKKVVIIKN